MATISQSLDVALDHHRAGRLDAAEAIYRRVLELQPDHARTWHLLGLVAYQRGQNDSAVEHIERAVRLQPANPVFHADLGEVQSALGNWSAAIAACRQAMTIEPSMADVHRCLGQSLRASGKLTEAIDAFREALKLAPNHAQSHHDLGDALRADGRLDEARAALETAVRLEPQACQFHFNLGRCCYDRGMRREAIVCYEEALRLAPGRADALYNCGLARLATGDLLRGWQEFDARLKRQWSPLSLWDGEPLAAGRLLIQAEHGLGDTLHFIRCVPLIEDRVGEVSVELQSRLIPLLTDSGFKNLVAQGEIPRTCVRRIPMMSLPRMLGTTLATVPASVPYLVARDELVESWRQQLADYDGFKVGICWQGGLAYSEDRTRSMPLAALAPLARVPGVQLFSLQVGHGREQLADWADDRGRIVDLADSLQGFIDTAAVIKNLDLIVTCDTAVGHLAGGLAAPVWLALSFAPDWRWMHERSDSPWYPSMRLFRQRTPGDWQSVFDEMVAELSVRVAQRSPAEA